MRKAFIAGILLAGALLAGCSGGIPGVVVTGSGRSVSRAVNLSDFDTVEANSAFNVTINRGENYQVTITADDNFMPYVRAEKEGGTLHLYMDENTPGGRGWKLGTLEAHITMPNLRELRLNGASHGEIDGFTQNMNVALSGASALKGHLEAGNLAVDASGASNTRLDGSAQELVLRGSGASRLELDDLRAGNARVDLSGASSAQVNAMGQLDYSVSGGSSLRYSGNPRIGQARSSGGASAQRQ